jgi:hypothetical protein
MISIGDRALNIEIECWRLGMVDRHGVQGFNLRVIHRLSTGLSTGRAAFGDKKLSIRSYPQENRDSRLESLDYLK